jgi:hypothetical protein
MLAKVTHSSISNRAGFRRMIKGVAIGFGVVVLSAASLGQASAQSDIASDILNDIFGEDWPFPTTGTVIVDEAPTQSADPGGIGEITLGGNTGGSVIMGGGSGGVSIGGGSSSSGGGAGSGNSAG